jgi:iron donor protein CyaY
VSVAEHSARLLVADDNKVNRLLLSRSLEVLGHRVASAENGRVALQMLRAEAFDLLLLDMEMPELDGFQVLEQMVADRQLRDLPVIVTSSLEGVAHVARCIELGADILSIEFGDGAKYVVNSHRAARQIWVAAEHSAWHFDWEPKSERWIASKTGEELWSVIERAVSTRLGHSITLSRD